MDPVAAHAVLRDLASRVPNLDIAPDQTTYKWLAELAAVLKLTGRYADQAKVIMASDSLGLQTLSSKSVQIYNALYRAIAELDLELPSERQGAFLAVGNTFDAMVAVSSVLRSATEYVLIVDAYMNEEILEKYALMVAENVGIDLLTDEKWMKPGLIPAAQAWVSQYGAKRPINLHATGPRVLHDRLIACDDNVWVVTQSLKDLAVRSPASISKVDRELAAAKIAAYTDIWDSSRSLLRTTPI